MTVGELKDDIQSLEDEVEQVVDTDQDLSDASRERLDDMKSRAAGTSVTVRLRWFSFTAIPFSVRST